jgi:metal-sulfur cluster biosynthetic enzyme
MEVTPDSVEIGMIFTTPFCPYGGVLLQQVKDMARTVTERDTNVELLDEPWAPDMMEGGDWSEWGLI